MNDRDQKLLRDIRDELRETLRTSERPRRTVTDHERLEDIAFQLTRTLNTIEHRIQGRELR